jgi:N-acetylglucosamine-6-sulfatase
VHRFRAGVTVLTGVVVAAGLAAPLLPSATPTASATLMRGRPNVVLITTDDMRPGDLRAMPFTRRVLARRGVTFSDAISPFPLCCPAKTSIVTGQYSHNHGVRSNTWPNGGYWAFRQQGNALPAWLRDRGYGTGFVGKYLNYYGVHQPPSLPDRRRYEVPPGWGRWFASVHWVNAYEKVVLNADTPSSRPHRIRSDRYQAGYLGDITEDMIGRFHQSGQPFFVWHSQPAPHRANYGQGDWQPPIPHPHDRGDFAHVGLPRSRTFRRAFNENTADKRGPMHDRAPVDADDVRRLHQRRLESLKAVDRAVAGIVGKLKATGEYDRTVLVFTSDNGLSLGQHRYTDKNKPYDAMLGVPMIVSAPGLKDRYRPRADAADLVHVPHTVTTMDVTATIVAATGADPGRPLDGLNVLRPEANPDDGPGDRAVLIESGPRSSRRSEQAQFVGVRTDRWTWLGWRATPDGQRLDLGPVEFYDRGRLPSQVTNIQGTGRFPGTSRRLAALTQAMWDCAGDACVQDYRE